MADSLTPDVPRPVAEAAHLMAGFPATWALAGGWAVEAWLGRRTRDHHDVDISLLLEDAGALFEHLKGWQLIAHHPPLPDDTTQLWDGRDLVLPAHLHARPWSPEPLPEHLEDGTALGFWLEFPVGERLGGELVLSREPPVALSLSEAIRQSPWRIPTLAPAMVLRYKAEELRPQDEEDFEALLSLLTDEDRAWLRESIATTQPDHAWLPKLA